MTLNAPTTSWMRTATRTAAILSVRGPSRRRPSRAAAAIAPTNRRASFLPTWTISPSGSRRPTRRSSPTRTTRKPPANTVAFGRASFVSEEPWADHWTQERKDLLKADAGYYEGKGADGFYLARIPVAVDAKLIELGKLKYNIYCVACHGYSGDGKGMIGTQWSYALPNYHDAKYKSPDANDPKAEFWKDGYLFHVARVGVKGTQWSAEDAGLRPRPERGGRLGRRLVHPRASGIARGHAAGCPRVRAAGARTRSRGSPGRATASGRRRSGADDHPSNHSSGGPCVQG